MKADEWNVSIGSKEDVAALDKLCRATGASVESLFRAALQLMALYASIEENNAAGGIPQALIYVDEDGLRLQVELSRGQWLFREVE